MLILKNKEKKIKGEKKEIESGTYCQQCGCINGHEEWCLIIQIGRWEGFTKPAEPKFDRFQMAKDFLDSVFGK